MESSKALLNGGWRRSGVDYSATVMQDQVCYLAVLPALSAVSKRISLNCFLSHNLDSLTFTHTQKKNPYSLLLTTLNNEPVK